MYIGLSGILVWLHWYTELVFLKEMGLYTLEEEEYQMKGEKLMHVKREETLVKSQHTQLLL